MSKKKVMVNEEKIETTFGFTITEDEPFWANQENSDEQKEKITKSPSFNNDTKNIIGFVVPDNNNLSLEENKEHKSKKNSSFKKYFQNFKQQENEFSKETTITQSAPLQVPEDNSDEFEFSFYPNSVTSYGKNSGSKIPEISKIEIIKPKIEENRVKETTQFKASKTQASSLPIKIINTSTHNSDVDNNPLWKYFKDKPISKQIESENYSETHEKEYLTLSGNSEEDLSDN